jgi:hypothetical protein
MPLSPAWLTERAVSTCKTIDSKHLPTYGLVDDSLRDQLKPFGTWGKAMDNKRSCPQLYLTLALIDHSAHRFNNRM